MRTGFVSVKRTFNTEIDKKIEENTVQVEGASLPEAEERRLFEERTRLLEERAELQAQLKIEQRWCW